MLKFTMSGVDLLLLIVASFCKCVFCVLLVFINTHQSPGISELQGLAVLKPRGYFAALFNNGWERVYPGTFRPMLAWALQTIKMKSLSLLRLGPDYRVGFLRWNTEEMVALVGLVDAGKVTVHLSETCASLEGCAAAVEAVGKGHTRGKVAVTVQGVDNS